MKPSLAAAVSAIVLACAPVFAQGAAPAPSADPAVVDATRQMLAAMHVRDMMTKSLAGIEQQMPAQMRATLVATINGNPNLTTEQKAAQLQQVDAIVARSAVQAHALFSDPTLIDDMVAEMVPLYAETYTLDEIRQLAAFYASPLGQKMQASMPALMMRSMEINQRVMLPRIQKALALGAQPAPGQ